jgi:putative tryptophan/tyrosine transport system substrate-binding protein
MRSFKSIPIIIGLLCCLAVSSGHASAAEGATPHIVILVSHQGTPYEDGLQGFWDALSEKGIQVRHEVFQLNGDEKLADQVIAKLTRKTVNLILSLGSLATRASLKNTDGIPIVAGLILDGEFLKARSNVTGVSMEFPLELQLQWISRVLPGCKNVGMIYSTAQAGKIGQAVKAAKQAGMELRAEAVKTPSELPLAMDSLAKRADVLWGLPDEMVFNPQTAKHILLYSFRNRIPVVGISDAWVKAGALFALTWDYKDLGRQCGEMAVQILQGTPPQALPLSYPRKVGMVLNLKTALQLKVDIPEAVLRSAQEVYK